MDLKAIELIETITLHKENFTPKVFEKGTVLYWFLMMKAFRLRLL